MDMQNENKTNDNAQKKQGNRNFSHSRFSSRNKNNFQKGNGDKGKQNGARSNNNGRPNGNRDQRRSSFQRNNNYGFPRIENEPREDRGPSVAVAVDDHPRAMVLPFDQKAIEDAKPRKYTSGVEIFRININLARWLTLDNYLDELSKATEVTFADRSFITLKGESLPKLKAFAEGRLKSGNLEKALIPFYKHMAYFAKYAIENSTAVIFDL